MKTLTLPLALLAALSGCYGKTLVLQAEVVSMTKTDAPAQKHLKEGDEITEKWCTSEEPALRPDGGDKRIGMADQVIYKAQQAHRPADYLTNVRVYRDTDGCALLSGRPATL